MQYLWLRILVCVVVIVVLSLYLYDNGAHRVYDIVISAVVIVATCWLFAALAIVCAVRNKRVFDTSDGDLKFTFPDNKLNRLPFFLLVFIGRRHIMPMLLLEKK